MGSLPMGIPVEIEAIIEVAPARSKAAKARKPKRRYTFFFFSGLSPGRLTISAGSAHRAPATPVSAVSGMSSARTPRAASASSTALTTAGTAPWQPASPTPLAPSGFCSVGTVWSKPRVQVRQQVGARHRVVHERAGHELAGFVVDRLLDQRLPESLRDAAVHLPFRHQRIDHRADVVDRDVARHAHRAGLGIHLDLAHLAAVRPGLSLHRLGVLAEDAPLGLLCRQLGQPDRAVGAGDAVAAGGKLDVACGRLEFARRKRAPHFDQREARRPPPRCRPPAGRANPRRRRLISRCRCRPG